MSEATQTEYTLYPARAFAGGIENPSICELRCAFVETGPIGFAKPIARGTTENTIVAAAAAADFIGITRRSVTPASSAPGLDDYAQGQPADYIQRGFIWVTVDEAVTVGAAAGFDPATGNFVLAATGEAIEGGVFETAAAAGGLALLRIV
jgi:hypothetical protein